MLKLIYGTDPVARNTERDRILKETHHTEHTVLHRTGSALSFEEVRRFSEETSLFREKFILVYAHPSEQETFFTSLLDVLESLHKADNLFLVIEREITKDILKKFEKVGAQIIESKEEKKIIQKQGTLFALTDAIQAKKKKDAWILLHEAYRNGKDPVEIAGMIFWSLKTLFFIARDESGSKKVLNPFVFTKTKKTLLLWSVDELEKAMEAIVSLVHRGRIEGDDSALALEQFVLQSIPDIQK